MVAGDFALKPKQQQQQQKQTKTKNKTKQNKNTKPNQTKQKNTFHKAPFFHISSETKCFFFFFNLA